MMIGQIVPLAEVDRAGFLRFTQAGRRCVVVETWGMYYGLIAQHDGFARVVSEGWSREWVASATAVAPIAMPINTRRTKASGSAARAGEAGCSRSTVKAQAESMKDPRRASSMRYSGQWARDRLVTAFTMALG